MIKLVYTRKVKRGNKVYLYKYKSQRVNGKVKSIYVGKEELKAGSKKTKSKPANKKVKLKISKLKNDIPSYLMQFNHVITEINSNLVNSDVEKAALLYKDLLKLYDKVIKYVDNDDKMQLYNKVKEIYETIVANAENTGYIIE